jgi:hypothetical protein
MGRVTDNLSSGKVFADLGLPPMNPEEDRAMVCGSLAFNVDVKAILEGFGLREGRQFRPEGIRGRKGLRRRRHLKRRVGAGGLDGGLERCLGRVVQRRAVDQRDHANRR